MTQKFRPKITASILQWALLDVVGMVIVTLGGLYLLKGQTLIDGFPSSTMEAITVVIVGIGTVFAAGVKILTEVMIQAATGQDGPASQE